MAFQTLYRAKSFGPGAQLWVVPTSEDSDLVRRIDWYLNFQIAKSKKHSGLALSKDLTRLIENHKLRLPQIQIDEPAPLMIAAEQYFPCEMIVQMQMSEAADWVEKLEKIWLQLGRPRLRLFLPKSQTPENLQKLWPRGFATSDEISLVPA